MLTNQKAAISLETEHETDPSFLIPPEQVVGTAGGTKYGYEKNGKPYLTKEPKLLLNDNFAGKPEGIHMMIGRGPIIAFGNAAGDRQMLEYTWAAARARADDAGAARRRDARICLWPGRGIAPTKIGTFPQSLHDEAKAKGWS